MTIDVRINGQSIGGLLAAPPVVKDQLNSVCRTLELKVRAAEGLINYMGQPIELWYGGALWYFGFLFRRSFDAKGNVDYTAYDPLIWLKKNPDDYYFTNMTATQIFRDLAKRLGIKTGSLANTGAVFQALYYQGGDPDKILVDSLARTAEQTGRNYWYRYEPVAGLTLFERVVPSEIWAFQVGVNLESARYEESIEETATVIKLVNRETGKTVVRADAEAIKRYGGMQHFEEVDKDAAATMERKAQELLKQMAKVKVTSSIEGVNPDQVMPQFYSGDVIYVEEDYTQLIGAYHILNITQTFTNDNLIQLGIDVQAAPDIPALQYSGATSNSSTKSGGYGLSGASDTSNNNGVSTDPEYSAEMLKVIDQYGLEGGGE